MKRGIIVNLKQFRLIDYVTQNKVIIIICLVFLAGITIGSTALLKNSYINENIEAFFTEFINIHKNNTFFKKLLLCSTKYLIIFILYFIAGSSMFGVAITPFITMWQGILIGTTTSYVYKSLGLNGVAFNIIILLPPLSLFSVCCFFAAQCSINFSLSIVKLTMPKCRPTNLYIGFKDFCKKFLLLIIGGLACSLFEIILNSLFLKFFNF